jgi:hypothetical protein
MHVDVMECGLMLVMRIMGALRTDWFVRGIRHAWDTQCEYLNMCLMHSPDMACHGLTSVPPFLPPPFPSFP